MSGKVKAWIEAMRLRTLPVSCAGVIAGTGCALAYDSFRWVPATICLVFAIVAQIASNFANEYYDFKNGLDKKGREGFRRGVTEGDLSPEAMKRATYMLLCLDALLGCSLIYFGGWWLIAIGVAVALFALGYSTGPYPLSHHGLGDIAVIVFFGFVPVVFTCYLQTGVWEWRSVAVPVSIGIGMMAANVLIVNNYRDRDDDFAVGKHTSVVILGRGVMAGVYLLFGLGALAIFAVATYGFGNPLWWWISLGCAGVLTVRLWVSLISLRGKALNKILGQTAVLLLFVSVLLLLKFI